MAGRLYAFLVGINQYRAVRKLRGCVNDVETFEGYLKDRFGSQLDLLTMKDGEAERANVIKGFEHLERATKEDVALFMFCGHGAQSPAAGEFLHLDATGKDEGLVCVDSRSEGIPDLADKELAVLFERVARNGPHFAAIFDCCHSGSGTRDIDELQGAQPRYTPASENKRNLADYLDGHYKKLHAAGDFHIPESTHVLLAACDRTQKALEKNGSGVFSSTMMEVLTRPRDRVPNYAQLFADCRVTVRKRASNQDPQFDSYGGFNAYSGFLGGAADSGVKATVFFRGGSWMLDRGALTGISNDPERPTNFRIVQEGQDEPLARGMTTSVGSAESAVRVKGNLDLNATYRAEITDMPAAPLPVFTDSDHPAIESLRTALEASGQAKLVGDRAAANWEISVREKDLASQERESIVLSRFEPPQEFWGLFQQDVNTKLAVGDAVWMLGCAARHHRLGELQNRYTKLDPESIEFSLKVHPGETNERRDVNGMVKMTYHPSGEEGRDWASIPVLVEATNTIEPTGNEEEDINNTRHVALLYFSEKLGIRTLRNEPLPPGATVQLYGTGAPGKGKGLRLKNGQTETHDHFKLFVSTDTIPDELMTQPDLEVTRSLSRDLDDEDEPTPKVTNDWFTKSIRVRGVGITTELSPDREVALADGDIVIKPHARARAKVSLNSPPSAQSRDVGAGVHTALQGFNLVGLGNTRDTDGGTVVELTDIQNAEALADDPLEIDLKLELDPDEYLLPMTFDGEHFLMVGPPAESTDGTTTVSIDHVPETQFDEDRRSLGKALKLYLFRTYLRQSVDELAWVEFAEDGTVTRHTDGVRDKVIAAKNILLLIHGIIGDTQNIAEGIGEATTETGAPLRDSFDLVLTFDYENLGREIQDTAKVLGEQLTSVDLGPDDGKRLTILAHSMGGLVSRHYIEQQGGAAVVDHLVMCGTPNGGSPFGKIGSARKVLSVLAGVAMNVPALAALGPAVGFVLNRSKKVTITLEQMDETSPFLTGLNAADDPGIPYTVLAGNVRDYRERDDALIKKLVARVGAGNALEALHGGTENHDIAVALESIRNLDELRKHKPVKMNVACHHLNYFSSEEGLGALKEVKW